jgi:hypothetical protein
MVNEDALDCYNTTDINSSTLISNESNDSFISDSTNTEIKTVELGNGVTITYPNIEINPFYINSFFLLMGILVGISISTLIVSAKK